MVVALLNSLCWLLSVLVSRKFDVISGALQLSVSLTNNTQRQYLRPPLPPPAPHLRLITHPCSSLQRVFVTAFAKSQRHQTLRM